MHPLRVLCIDIEGGYGGSSRSLFESIRQMNRSDVAAEVWCRRDGPIRARYEEINIPCRVFPGMPKMNSLKRFSRNLYGYSVCLREFILWHGQRVELARAMSERFDLVHFNHEGLFCLAAWLRRHHRKPQVMHIRTKVLNNVFGRMQARRIIRSNDSFVYITENERENIERLTGRKTSGEVIYNIAMPALDSSVRKSEVPLDHRLKIAVLSNYAFNRGIDRTIEIAEALAARGRRDLLFVVAGDMRLGGSLPGELGRFAGRTLGDYAAARGVGDMFLFLGHVTEPESVLSACDLLLKPTREDNPWGRDILESLAAGKPVISVGQYNRFVETGATGFLLERYDPDETANIILHLDGNRILIQDIGNNGKKRVAALCNGPDRARDLVALWRAAIEERRQGLSS